MGDEDPEETLDHLARRTAMHLLRYTKDMDQAAVARAVRISSGQASHYEPGDRILRSSARPGGLRTAALWR